VGDDRAGARRLATPAVLVVLLLAGCGGGSETPRLDAALQRVVSAGVPGALVLVRDGNRTRTAAVGLADVGAHRKLRSTDRFRVGSVTKTFVAAVVLELVAEQRLRLGDPVALWLPGLLPDGGRITIRDLLAHRSGLADVADDPAVLDGDRSDWPPRRLVALVSRRPRIAAPGGAFHYSSTNYLVLGLLVERVTGRSLAAELRQRITTPLRLTDTTYRPGALVGRHVHGYRLASHQGVVDPAAPRRDLEGRSVRWAGASGDLVSSAGDLARFLAALLGGDLLPARELRAMEAVSPRYGLGLAVYPTRCGLAWGHTGNLNGVLTIAWSTRDGRRQAVLMANAYPLPAAADVALRRAAVTAFCD
jgi:D-alanyl-D-alanine carboxypeptidase